MALEVRARWAAVVRELPRQGGRPRFESVFAIRLDSREFG